MHKHPAMQGKCISQMAISFSLLLIHSVPPVQWGSTSGGGLLDKELQMEMIDVL